MVGGFLSLTGPLAPRVFEKKAKKPTTWKRTWPMMVLMYGSALMGVCFIFIKNTIPIEKMAPLCAMVGMLLLLSAACAYVLWKSRTKPDLLRSNARNLFCTLLLLLLVPISFLYFDKPLINPALKKSVEIIQEDSAGRPISLWTGYNDGPYAEFCGIPCYMDTRAEVFLPKLNHKKDVFAEYIDLLSGYVDYHDFMKNYHFTHLLTTSIDPLYAYLKNDKDYILLWDSDTDDSLTDKEKNTLKCKYRVYTYHPQS